MLSDANSNKSAIAVESIGLMDDDATQTDKPGALVFYYSILPISIDP